MLELIRFGAVHWCKVPPPPQVKEGAMQLREMSRSFLARQAALRTYGQYVSSLYPSVQATEHTMPCSNSPLLKSCPSVSILA